MTSIINNFASWLPPYGESEITFESNSDDVRLCIFYNNFNNKRYVRQINFTNVKSFISGVTTSDVIGDLIQVDSRESINALVRVEPSKFLQFYQNKNLSKYNYVNQKLKHFMIFFTAEDMVIHAIAESVIVSNSKIV